MSFGDDTLDPSNVNQIYIDRASAFLKEYLNEFPECDQGDFRVWSAWELLEKVRSS
jgi:hypothetical protein